MCFKCLIIVTSSTYLIIEHVIFTMVFPFLSGYSFFFSPNSRHTGSSDNEHNHCQCIVFNFQAQNQLKKLQ